MSSLGSYLRELRQRRGVSLEEIARSTRVLHLYLEALEADDFDALPAPVFTKGFVRAYCQILGEPPDQAFALWEQRGGAAPEPAPAGAPARMAARPGGGEAEGRVRKEARGRGAILVSFVLLVVLGVALFVLALALQSGRDGTVERRPATAEPPRASLPAAAAAATPGPPPAPILPAVGGVPAPYRLVARTSERTWIRVRTEDGRTSEENIPPGETREWVSNRPFVLTIGNAGGVALELNGRSVPRLGPSGAVIERFVLPSDSQ
jgi:transcriptional regulator with XRE-family HTH domain